MNVLFVMHLSPNSCILKSRNLFYLINTLKKEDLVIGLVSNIDFSKMHLPPAIKLNKEAIIDNFWDVQVIHDEYDLELFRHFLPKIQTNGTIVFTDHPGNQPFYLTIPGPLVIATSLVKKNNHKFLPSTQIVQLPWFDLDFKFKSYHKIDTINVLYYIEEHDLLHNTLEFVKFFNVELKAFKLFILCNDKVKSILAGIVNSNIEIISLKEIPNFQFSVALVSGKIALSTILSRIPTIVISRYGFGSLVTPHNISQHYDNQFNGRIGGSLNETIPISIVVSEIKNIANFKNTHKNYLDENQSFLKEKLNNVTINDKFMELLTLIRQQKSVEKQAINSSMHKKVMLESGIKIYNGYGEQPAYYVTNDFNKIVMELAQNEYDLLQLIQKPSAPTLADIYKKEHHDFMEKLYNQSVIRFA